MIKKILFKLFLLFFIIFFLLTFLFSPLFLTFKPFNISIKDENIFSTKDINVSSKEINLSDQLIKKDLVKENNLNLNENMIVFITDKGFEPQRLEIKKGTTVIWFNLQNKLSWPMSKLESNKCNNLYKNQIFNACRSLKNGETWSFTFNESGEWIYYDYLNPQWEGKILVK